ncbi:MAG TPA: orotate phosphoribosyltransferase [Pyrinomonadaceae bacterium]|nr:orotate phosphoribosyltransferase [Pyrinomonadaceae bacterium]
MKAEEVVQEFKDKGALLEGHFQLSSGLHSTVYLQCARVLQYPDIAERFGQAIARNFEGQEIQLVASPAIGGLIIGHEVARALGARFVWTEREKGVMTLRRGFSVSDGERTLVVEDVITTGGSTRETIEVLKAAGANVVGAASIIDRSKGDADVGVPRITLASLKVTSVEAANCDACRQGEPITKPGSKTQSVVSGN